jgi:3'(2'), 5'-bisphosphate nucleotidase
VRAGEPDDHRLASDLATGAGELLLELRASAPRGDVGRRGDEAAHRWLLHRLAVSRSDDAVLSEEGADDPARLLAERVWIIDPLDGTREFAEGRDDWAVHVALWCAGRLTAAAVALPARGIVLSTAEPRPAPPRGRAPLRVAVSRTRPPVQAHLVADAMGAELVPLGSAGYKVGAVVLGEVDAYLHAGGQYEWDSAAPVAVARAAGLHASRVDGSGLEYNQPDPLLPDLLVAPPDVAGAVLDVLRTAPAPVMP